MQNEAYQLNFTSPIRRWDEALPLGSGFLGALLYGENPIRLSLDRSDLWDLRPAPQTMEEGYTFETLLRLVKAKKQKEITPRFASFYNTQPHPTKIPAGALEFRLPETPKEQKSRLDFWTATASMEFRLEAGTASLTAFLSREGDLGYLLWNGDCHEELTLLPPDFQKKEEENIDSLSRLGYLQAKAEQRENFACFVQPTGESAPYAVLCGWRETEAGRLYVFTVASGKDGSAWMEEAAKRVQLALEEGWDAAHARHTAWWRDYHALSAIELPNGDAAIKQHWVMNNYLFASTSRKGCPPLALQGVWTADNGKIPPWKGDYHYDLNVQLSYSHYLAANRWEAGESIVEYLLSLAPAGRQFAKEFFGCDGLTLPSVSDLAGRPMGGWAQYSYSPMNHLWSCQLLADYIGYTGDTALLLEQVYPYLKESAGVPLHLLKEDETGTLRLPVSTSPEYFSNLQKAWFRTETNYDLALLRAHFETLARFAMRLNNGEEGQWNAILQKLPPLATDKKGALKITRRQSYHQSHRHQSHAMAIYPLRQIHYQQEGRRIIDATLRRTQKKGTKQWTGYTFPWVSCLYSMAKDGENARAMLREYLAYYISKNGFHLNDDVRYREYRPFTLEGNFAFNDALQNMLLGAGEGRLELFPAVPASWLKEGVGFDKFRAPGGLTVSAQVQENRLTSLRICSPEERKITLLWRGAACELRLKEGCNDISLPLKTETL